MTAFRLWGLALTVLGIVLASLAFAVMQLGWHRAGHTNVLPVPVAPAPASEAAAPQRDINKIAALAPFGQTIDVQQATTPDVPVQTLNLALRGVLVDPDPAVSRAFILVAGTTSVFTVGADVEGAELVAINVDTVTLKSGDDLVIVGFDGVKGQADTPAATPDAVNENPDDPFARLAAALVPANGSIDLREVPPPETTEEYINQWRTRILQNPQSAMDSVGVEVVENGYRVKADPNIGVTLAGLKPGDVVTRLNGQTVGDLEKDKKLYDEVAAAGIARLEVVRDGRAMLLTFPLR